MSEKKEKKIQKISILRVKYETFEIASEKLALFEFYFRKFEMLFL